MAVAITEPFPARLPHLHPLWHRSAPQRVVERCRDDDPVGGWKAWRKHLSGRRAPESPPFLAEKEPPLLWGWPQAWQRDFVTKAIKSPSLLAETFLAEDATAAPDLSFALRTVALAYSLPLLAEEFSPNAWWQLAERLHELASQAQQHRVDWPADPSDVVRQQLLAGELSLALGYLFPEVRALRALRKLGRATLSEGLIELTDGQGLPHALLLEVLGPLMACWTRVRWLGTHLKNGPWSRRAELQYQWLVRHALRLADKKGRFLLTSLQDDSPAWTKSMFSMAIELAGDRGDRAVAAVALPRGVVPDGKTDDNDLPAASLNSDWSGISVLANGWSGSDIRFAVAHANDTMNIALSVGGDRLLAGPWRCDTTCDGEVVKPVGEWEQLCWESGKQFDFLELGVELSHDLRLERQIMLGREDRVLYLADIVVASDGAPRRLKHSMRLPFDHSVEWVPEPETRDGVIFGRKLRAIVLPLGLSEWRADPRGGSLDEENGWLTLTQQAQGRALCCPLFFDLDGKRAKRECTWRQLTVAEALEIVPADAAVGYRAQSGCDQWLIYRSLGPAGNRTVLGQNISGEFSAGRFLDSGKYKEWIEIEPV